MVLKIHEPKLKSSEYKVKGKRGKLMDDIGELPASKMFKLRISKGFVNSTFGEGYIVEVWDMANQKICLGEIFRELEPARERERTIRNDIESMNAERFTKAYNIELENKQ